MNKIYVIAVISASLSACNSSETGTTSVDTDSSVNTTTTTTTTTSYTAADGDVSYRAGKLMIWKNGDWVESNEDVTLNNRVVVRRNGEVRRDNDVVNLREGEVINKTGKFFDNAGNAIEDGWDATKRGARKVGNAMEEGAQDAGNAIEKGAKKVGEKTKDVFDGKERDSTN